MRTVCSSRLWHRLGLTARQQRCVHRHPCVNVDLGRTHLRGMRAGLQIHNTVMREVMRMCGGYEVKTIGDAFMIAFASTCDGVAFGLRVQERLFEADWPASLLEDAPICSRQGSLWGGLTVRIGVNTGPVTVEQNTLTGRTDYFGHTVNVASRLESTCTPGAVAVPSDLWTSVSGSCSAVAGVPEAVHLKGVSGTRWCAVCGLSHLGTKGNTTLRVHVFFTNCQSFNDYFRMCVVCFIHKEYCSLHTSDLGHTGSCTACSG